MRLTVSSWPGWPAVGPSCHTCMSCRLSESFGGMTRRCSLVSFQKGHDDVSIDLMGYVSSHSFIVDVYWFWQSVIILSNKLSESASATHMNIAAGRIVICWLLSLPSSDPVGQDRVSAAV